MYTSHKVEQSIMIETPLLLYNICNTSVPKCPDTSAPSVPKCLDTHQSRYVLRSMVVPKCFGSLRTVSGSKCTPIEIGPSLELQLLIY